jgi:hypothetical protein
MWDLPLPLGTGLKFYMISPTTHIERARIKSEQLLNPQGIFLTIPEGPGSTAGHLGLQVQWGDGHEAWCCAEPLCSVLLTGTVSSPACAAVSSGTPGLQHPRGQCWLKLRTLLPGVAFREGQSQTTRVGIEGLAS